MSHSSKLDFLRAARGQNYRTYLYFIATADPQINLNRVENRVRSGGHPVPREKIIERYYRSLELLGHAIRLTDRAYIFDNSRDHQDSAWIAEITGGTQLELKVNEIPHWFDHYVLARYASSP